MILLPHWSVAVTRLEPSVILCRTEMVQVDWYLNQLVAMEETKLRLSPTPDATTDETVFVHVLVFGGVGGLDS